MGYSRRSVLLLADDTIYISQQFARRVWLGFEHGAGGKTAGDFGVAAVIAHEYAHNIQTEVGVYRAHPHAWQSMRFELEADCMSGVWANNAYYQGILEAGDPEEAMATIAAFGDTICVPPITTGHQLSGKLPGCWGTTPAVWPHVVSTWRMLDRPVAATVRTVSLRGHAYLSGFAQGFWPVERSAGRDHHALAELASGSRFAVPG